MPWYKFLRPNPEKGLYSPSRYYIEGVDVESVLLNLTNYGVNGTWFDSEVDASEVPGLESTCPLEEKFKPEGYADAHVFPLEGRSYISHRWSDYGFEISGYGFTYGTDNNEVSDVYASNPEGWTFSGPRVFEFISQGFDLSKYQNSNTTMTVGEFDEGIKFQKVVYQDEEEDFPPSVHYTFWAEDREIIVEYQEKLSLIADDLKDLTEMRNEMLEGFC